MRTVKLYFLILFLSLFGVVRAQQTDDIGTETVTVVKPYSPSVSDAFKIKLDPVINDSIELQKKPIEYVIFSVPVASTFTPAKAKAARVEKRPPPTLYNSYASVGLGNFNNAIVDFYTSRKVGRDENLFDVGLTHFSSRGDIDSTPLDTDFYNTNLDLSFAKKDRDYDWSIGLGLGHQLYNWYGLESGAFTDTQIEGIDELQNYFNAEANAQLTVEDSFFKNGKLLVRRFWDALESGENRAVFKTELEIPISSELVNFKTKVDYVGGEFENASLNSTTNTAGIDYGHLIVGVNPSFVVLRDELTLHLGANLVYGTDLERSNGNFFIYPAITASYRLVEDQVIAYGGIEGDLNQNSYYDFVGENPFVSPTLEIQPTDQQYMGYAGLKGQLTTNIGYNVKGFYRAENRRPLFFLNPQNLFRDDEGGYNFGNSFQVFYDDIRTLGFFAEINVDINRNFTLGLNGEYFNYNTETDNPAWNLPEIQGSLFMDYQISDKWYAGANLFFVGEREDLQSVAAENTPPNEFVSNSITLDSFFDANAHLGYRFNDQLSVFAKVSNLANNNYERWSNFRVQGFQALAGVSYKFDF
ncbi:TonB-dependent receptor [Muricauda sp. SCSIO 64092]|uniref:TonB-dependent receptor n=1 Tax=Allomuricauda sp. SCSIO 64092 TaxID=2908842 RepID=UPI001FF433B1|nr:TonB-dependent receptor [Muricauda sp. SCSIO 64092]UOY05410.1 TonB-dependent receptor [Muricauda sp. SCSIO 64092]